MFDVNDALLEHATAVENDYTRQQRNGKSTDETTTARFGHANNTSSDQ
jgi:hypothetical protein